MQIALFFSFVSRKTLSKTCTSSDPYSPNMMWFYAKTYRRFVFVVEIYDVVRNISSYLVFRAVIRLHAKTNQLEKEKDATSTDAKGLIYSSKLTLKIPIYIFI